MKNHTTHNTGHHEGSLLETVASATEDTLAEGRNRIAAAMETAKETYANLQKKAVRSAKATDKMIRSNPYQAVGIAIGLGAILGYCLTRRSRD